MTFYCLGDLMVDVVARLFGPLTEGSDSPAVISYVGGGSAANTAAWLATAGVETVFVGAVGEDTVGQAQVAGLRALGIDVHGRVDHDRPTGTCLVLVAPDGERTMVPDAGANLALLDYDVPTDEFEPGDHLHLSGYALLRDSREAALHAISHATSVGMSVSVGAASAAPLRVVGAAEFLGMLPEQVLLVANESEAGVLAGTPFGSSAVSAAELASALATGSRSVVVTAGSGDAVWADATTVASMAAEPLPSSELDTTGAGDAFAAGFLAARARAAVPEVCLRDGHALAAAACRTVGGRPA